MKSHFFRFSLSGSINRVESKRRLWNIPTPSHVISQVPMSSNPELDPMKGISTAQVGENLVVQTTSFLFSSDRRFPYHAWSTYQQTALLYDAGRYPINNKNRLIILHPRVLGKWYCWYWALKSTCDDQLLIACKSPSLRCLQQLIIPRPPFKLWRVFQHRIKISFSGHIICCSAGMAVKYSQVLFKWKVKKVSTINRMDRWTLISTGRFLHSLSLSLTSQIHPCSLSTSECFSYMPTIAT